MSLKERLALLTGRKLGDIAVKALQQRIALPDDWADILQNYTAAGTQLRLAENDDISGLGAEIELMDDSDILTEAFETYPGILAVPLGYIPFGTCTSGSGDPYFIRTRDGFIVRIPHDAASTGTLDESQIEDVASSFEDLITKATIE